MTETESGAEVPQPGVGRRLGAWLAALLVRVLHATMRMRHVNRDELQRLQVACSNSQPSAPLAVDVALSSSALEVAD